MLSRFTHGIRYPHGLIALSDCTQPNKLTRIAQTLHTASPEEFPLESFISIAGREIFILVNAKKRPKSFVQRSAIILGRLPFLLTVMAVM